MSMAICNDAQVLLCTARTTQEIEISSEESLQDPNDNSMLDMLIGYSCIQICILLLSLLSLLSEEIFG